MIQIDNLTVKEESLTLDYQVTNPFTSDIWICEDIDDYARNDVETRIGDGTLQIKLRFDLESNLYVPQVVYAKYRRLSPGESHSGRILLKLPIRNNSPIYNFREFGKKQKRVVLHRAVFEVGYFERDLLNIAFEKISKIRKGKPGPTKEETCLKLLLLLDPIVIKHSDPNIVYLPHWWPGESMEKCAKIVVTDVDIPCSVAIGDK